MENFNHKLAEALWTLLEPRIEQKLAQFRDEIGTFDGDIDNQISNWMDSNFNLDDYGFRIDDYSFDIDGMIDNQVQYLAEEGDLKAWIKDNEGDNDEKFKERVFQALGEIDMKFGNMTVTYGPSVIVKE